MNSKDVNFTFSHIGVIDDSVDENEEYVPAFDIYRIDADRDPMSFERTKFCDKSKMNGMGEGEIHIGFDVDDMEKAIKLADEVILAPVILPENKQIALIRRMGVLIELIYRGA